MNVYDVDLVHKDYKDTYQDCTMIGSQRIFIPFFKVILKMEYIAACELPFAEKYICRCIDAGINRLGEIQDVLGLDNVILSYIIQSMEDNGYIGISGEVMVLTEEGQRLFTSSIKHESRAQNIEWYFDGLSPEYKIDFFGEEQQHQFYEYRDIIKEKSYIYITPRTIPDYNKDRDFRLLAKRAKSVLSSVENDDTSRHGIFEISSFDMTGDRKVYYHEYLLLIFKTSTSEYKMLAYDPCMKTIDQRITNNILELYRKGEIKDQIIQDGEVGGISDIIDKLKNYAREVTVNLDGSERDAVIEALDTINTAKALSYIMNYEIRELFLRNIKTAKESIFIISAWMNHHVMNNELISDIKNLLSKGVKIVIVYGITTKEDIEKERKDLTTHQIAEKLKKIGEDYTPGLLSIIHGQTHEKVFICDRKFVICGSFNLLSYAGEDNQFFRNEGTIYSEDPVLIEQIIKLRFETQSERAVTNEENS